MKKKLAILLLIVILSFSGCGITQIDPTEETPHPTPGSNIRSGSKDGFSWEVDGNTLIVTGEGTLSNLFSEEWGNLVYEITELKLDPRITAIGSETFSMLFQLKGELVLHEGLISVGERAFNSVAHSMSITHLPSSLKRIGKRAFESFTLPETLVIPETIEYIDDEAFADNFGMKTLILNNETQYGKKVFSGSLSLENVQLPEDFDNISRLMFRDCINLKSINLPKNLKTLPHGIFMNCQSLAEIEIPNTVTEIGSCAFLGCNALESISLPDHLLIIEERAFENCTSLTEISIPASVNTIGQLPFSGCTALDFIQVSESNPHYSNDVQGALYNKDKTWIIQVTPGKTGSFYIPNTVSQLEPWTFQYTLYSEIIVPESVKTLRWQALGNSDKLKKIILPDSITDFQREMFKDCPKLEVVRLPSNLDILKANTFTNCKSLKEVHLPASITRIETHAFRGCSEVRDIYFEGSREQWQNIEIWGHNEELKEFKIHYNVPYPPYE